MVFEIFLKKGSLAKRGGNPVKKGELFDIFNVLSTELTHSEQRGLVPPFYIILPF